MRIFSSARIAVIDPDAAHRNALCAALAGYGMLHILPAAGFAEARELDRRMPLDLCVVHLPAAGKGGQGSVIPANPFAAARTPAILLAPSAGPDMLRLAQAQGYQVVLPLPAAARIVYRRIGSILQKRRRADRLKEPACEPAAARAPELQQS